MLAPAGTPKALIERLNREINEVAGSPEVRALLDPDGALPAPMTPAAYAARIESDHARCKRIATERNIVIE